MKFPTQNQLQLNLFSLAVLLLFLPGCTQTEGIRVQRSREPQPAITIPPPQKISEPGFKPVAVPPALSGQERVCLINFDDASLATDRGVKPVGSPPVQFFIPSFEGRALFVQGTNRLASPLRYHFDSEREAAALRSGTIRLFYRPDWSSNDPKARPGFGWGKGPEGWAALFEIGVGNERSLILLINAEGTSMIVQATEKDKYYNLLQVPVSFTYGQPDVYKDKPRWHEIILRYGHQETQLCIDGIFSAGGFGVPAFFSASNIGGPLTIGSSYMGTYPARGEIDQFEVYNFGFSKMSAFSLRMGASARDENGAINLRWRKDPNAKMSVQELQNGTSNYVGRGIEATNWQVTNAVPGTVRTFQLHLDESRFDSEIHAGLRLPPRHDRGRVLLLVDQTIAPKLKDVLNQFEDDLRTDGFEVVRKEAPRHDDHDWKANPKNILLIKGMIQNHHRQDPARSKHLILVGHVAVPYSGMAAEDGHTTAQMNHAGAWSTDLFYADMDGLWTDTQSRPTKFPPAYAETGNEPGDGKFDQSYIPANSGGKAEIEMAVGRIDFAKLKTFGDKGYSEEELIHFYLQKNHAYRHGKLIFAPKVVVGAFIGADLGGDNLSMGENGLMASTALFGLESPPIFVTDPFTNQVPVLWGFTAGYGNPHNLQTSRLTTVTDLLNEPSRPASAFNVLLGSFFGDWNLGNENLLRTLLAGKYPLAVIWNRGYRFRFEKLGLADTLGEVQMQTANRPVGIQAGSRVMGILGDPTLRMNVVAPPEAVTVQQGKITWSYSGAAKTFYAYEPGIDGKLRLLKNSPATGNEMVLENSGVKTRRILLRAAELTFTGGGSYTNLSQGVWAP